MYQFERESFQEAYYMTFIFYVIIDNVIGGLILRCNAVKRIKERFDVVWNYLDHSAAVTVAVDCIALNY